MATRQQASLHISHVEIAVADLAKSLRYYRQDLGFHLILQTEHYADLGVDGNVLIRLLQQDNPSPRVRATGLYHVAILLPSRKDLGNFLHHVIKNQIAIGGAADHGVSEAIYLTDPEQNGIEVYVDKDESLWHDEFGHIVMTTAEVDYEGIYYDADDDGLYLGMPEGTVIGHLHLQVSDLATSEAFYRDLIGFQTTLDTFPQARFLSANQYHHHLGLNTWQSLGAKPPKQNAVGLKSFEIRYPNCETISAAMNRLKLAQFAVTESESGYRTQDPDQNQIYLTLNH